MANDIEQGTNAKPGGLTFFKKNPEAKGELTIFMQKLLCERFGHKISGQFIRDDDGKKYRGCEYCDHRQVL